MSTANHVLIVEDDESLRLVMGMQLRREGFEIQSAADIAQPELEKKWSPRPSTCVVHGVSGHS